ncbi:MAG: efflux RND transporter periplasmic adaptor subunit [Alphaproteobacteria bacterium]|nr:efflux RND transporter periplasmic adaptor subunit [Alphaproteobacteria bacterium]
MKRSYITAGGVVLVIAVWMLSGQFGDHSPEAHNVRPVEIEPRVAVRAETITARTHRGEAVIRGRTEANRNVVLRTRVQGQVRALPFPKGTRVKQGDLICKLTVDARGANSDEARAMVASRRLDYSAATELARKGHRAPSQVAAAKAALDAAQAALKRAEIAMSDISVVAPFDGVVEALPVEIGDFLNEGGTCARIVDSDPMLFVAQVSEGDISAFHVGDTGSAHLITGETVPGVVRFVAATADPATRTFRIELEASNPENTLRDGVTADIHIRTAPVEAHFISPAILTLNDMGAIGVRIVDSESRAQFMPVTIIANATDGVWITGLPKTATIITVGQEYVSDGVLVKAEQRTPPDTPGAS